MKATILKKISLSIISFMFCLPAFSKNEQIKEEPEKNYYGIGVTAGYLSSLGFSYRQFFADRLGFKVSGVGFIDPNVSFGTIGVQGMVVLGENEWSRFYTLAGISNFTTKNKPYDPSINYYDKVDDPSYVYIPSRNTQTLDINNNIGLGVGMEFGRKESALSLVIEVPLIVSFKKWTFNSFYPIPQLSVMYNF